MGIGTHAETGQFAVDPRPPRPGMLVLLEHDDARAFAEHEAVAIPVPRTAGRLRVVVARRQGARGAQKPPRPRFETQPSAPPAIMTSASPYSIRRPASPMLCVPVEQALTSDMFGPL
jgi:hypothetical protein